MTQPLTHRRTLSRRLLFAFIAGVAIARPMSLGFAQLSQTDPPAKSVNPEVVPSFEVAAIKPNRSGERSVQINNTPGRFTAVNVTVKMLIQFAYNVKGPELSGGPSWIDSERFNIDAKIEGNGNFHGERFEDANSPRKLMLRALLADRFQLKVAHQTKELSIYALMVAKNGPKFHESQIPAADPAASSDQGPHPGPSIRGRTGIMMSRGELTMTDAPMSALANALAGTLGRRVIDETGLKGNYGLKLQWSPDEGQGVMAAGAPGGPDGRPTADSALPHEEGPSIFTAIEEQLGLKLESRKSPVDTLLIEQIERPSED